VDNAIINDLIIIMYCLFSVLQGLKLVTSLSIDSYIVFLYYLYRKMKSRENNRIKNIIMLELAN